MLDSTVNQSQVLPRLWDFELDKDPHLATPRKEAELLYSHVKQAIEWIVEELKARNQDEEFFIK